MNYSNLQSIHQSIFCTNYLNQLFYNMDLFIWQQRKYHQQLYNPCNMKYIPLFNCNFNIMDLQGYRFHQDLYNIDLNILYIYLILLSSNLNPLKSINLLMHFVLLLSIHFVLLLMYLILLQLLRFVCYLVVDFVNQKFFLCSPLFECYNHLCK